MYKKKILIEQLEIWGDSFRPEMKRILKIE